MPASEHQRNLEWASFHGRHFEGLISAQVSLSLRKLHQEFRLWCRACVRTNGCSGTRLLVTRETSIFTAVVGSWETGAGICKKLGGGMLPLWDVHVGVCRLEGGDLPSQDEVGPDVSGFWGRVVRCPQVGDSFLDPQSRNHGWRSDGKDSAESVLRHAGVRDWTSSTTPSPEALIIEKLLQDMQLSRILFKACLAVRVQQLRTGSRSLKFHAHFVARSA